MLIKGDKRTIRAWTFYDWANSAFPLVINSAIFPAFYEYKTSHDENKNYIGDIVTVFGCELKNTEFYSYVVALALVIVCVTAPILSGIADYAGNKKRFLSIFCILGSISCAGLYAFDSGSLVLSMLPFLLATIGYWGSLVFYNAYLPEIAEEKDQDRVSARGFALGYFGSALLLIANLVFIMVMKMPTEWAFVTVAVWWLGFAQITLAVLPGARAAIPGRKMSFSKGFSELKKVWNELKHIMRLRRFLGAYFFYNMGVQTVMYMAVLFAAKEINWPDESTKTTSLIISILLIQFLGMAGSFLFSGLSKAFGNLRTLEIAVFFWALVCVLVFFFVYEPMHFYFTAAFVGLVMGGTQALSRSTYSKLLPETEDHASYFSFFDVVEKIGIVIGTLSFGLIEGVTGGMRNSVLVLISFFAIGFIMLLTVPKEKNIHV